MQQIHIAKDSKVLIVSDFHLRSKNFKTRFNYVQEVNSYFKRLYEMCVHYDVTVVIFLGDIFDNAYNEENSAQNLLYVISILKRMRDNNIELFTLMGNHELHKAHNGSPFFNIVDIQSERIKNDLQHIYYEIPYSLEYIKAYDSIRIQNSVFECFHFSDINKQYKAERPDCYKYIGLYHDAIVSSKVKNIIGDLVYHDLLSYMKTLDCDSLDLLANMDYADIGDIHTKVGEFKVGNCVTYLGGSIGRTQHTLLQSHENVELALYEIKENYVNKSYINFNLWKIKESFDEVSSNTKKVDRKELNEFKKALQQTYKTRNVNFDIENSNIPSDIKNICLDALTNDELNIKTINEVKHWYSINNIRNVKKI